MASSKEYEAARQREKSNRKAQSTVKKVASAESAWSGVAGKPVQRPGFSLGKVQDRTADERTRDVVTGKDLRTGKK
jgi:hypothetical protein